MALRSDPGFVKSHHFRQQGKEYETEGPRQWGVEDACQGEPKICRVETCQALKIEGVHHCSACNKCVYLMDHHCIWTGNCVGKGTFKFFVLFNVYVTI